MEEIEHFLHDHPLVLIEEQEVHGTVNCSGCRKSVSGWMYGCNRCEFFLHKSCAELPRQIQTFFHSCPLHLNIRKKHTSPCSCNACFGDVSLGYRCEGCDFDIHLECSQLPPAKSQRGDEEELIHHFTHRHELKHVDPSKHLEVVCVLCDDKDLCYASDTDTYGCEECNFYIHKSCVINTPRQINHLFHPSCPLVLIAFESYKCDGCDEAGSGLVFRCGTCDFKLDVKCALLPTIESKDACKIQHSAHHHPLALHQGSEFDHDVRCRACGESCLLDACFGCSVNSCGFFLHRTCAVELPQEIHHPFHPKHPLVLLGDLPNYKCKGCDEVGSDLAFRCRKCYFTLDVKCALLPTIESKDANKIQHSAHHHPLVLRQGSEFGSDVRCRACGENCLLDPCFGCSVRSCDFFLHKTCALDLPQEIHHPFHPQHPLVLLGNLPCYKCKACNHSYQDNLGLTYGCIKCKFQLDVKCALLPTIESKDANKIQHCAHEHPLVLHDNKEFGSDAQCRLCAESCFGSCFSCKECNFFLHKTCAIELHEKNKVIHHPFHPLHPLILSSPPPLPDHDTFQCSSCLGSDDWNLLRYRCTKCEFELHIDCTKPKSTIFKYEGHLHHLTYFDETLAPIQCNICHDDAQTCFFRCVACAFNIHIYCIPSTPKIIKHQCHLHPLTVTKSPFQYELISPEYADGTDDEFYCDVCEEKRYDFESVYYCADCKFIAEVRCILSELWPYLIIQEGADTKKGAVDSRDEGNCAKEATIVNLNYEITEFRHKKKALKNEIVKQRRRLQRLEEELEPIHCKLRELKINRFLYDYHFGHDAKEK